VQPCFGSAATREDGWQIPSAKAGFGRWASCTVPLRATDRLRATGPQLAKGKTVSALRAGGVRGFWVCDRRVQLAALACGEPRRQAVRRSLGVTARAIRGRSVVRRAVRRQLQAGAAVLCVVRPRRLRCSDELRHGFGCTWAATVSSCFAGASVVSMAGLS